MNSGCSEGVFVGFAGCFGVLGLKAFRVYRVRVYRVRVYRFKVCRVRALRVKGSVFCWCYGVILFYQRVFGPGSGI